MLKDSIEAIERFFRSVSESPRTARTTPEFRVFAYANADSVRRASTSSHAGSLGSTCRSIEMIIICG